MITEVDLYFTEGCGRCALGGTPACKVHTWPKELKVLRSLILSCGLTEELKWGMPCYTFQKKNIVLLAAFKEYAAVSFFKGALLNDVEAVLSKPGNNTRSARLMRFTNIDEIIKKEGLIKAFIYEAVEIEKEGRKVEFQKNDKHAIPDEFQVKLNSDKKVKEAFYALTPGRQRGYLLYFSQPKQSKTRIERIEKCIPHILNGKGLND